MRTDYIIPEQLDANAVETDLCEHIRFNIEHARQEELTYYDSFDWRLYRNNTVLEERTEGRQRILVLRGLNSNNPLAMARLSRRAVFLQDLPPGRLHDALAPALEMRELLPLARIRTRVRNLSMLNKHKKTVARVLIEQSTLQAHRRTRQQRLADRVVVLPVKGYRKPVARIRDRLEALQLVPDSQDPMPAVLSMHGITPGDYSSKLELQLDPDMRADRATRVILQRLLDILLINEPGTRKGTDTEHLHDFRVAIRRTRSALGQIRGVFPQRTVERYKREFAWLGQVTGNTRDLDVYLLNFNDYRNSLAPSMQGDIEPLQDFLQRHRQSEHKALVRALNSARYRRLLGSWRSFLEQPVNERSTLKNAQRPVHDVACKRIWRVYKRILKEGGSIRPDTPAEALHELRKTAKKLRYLMEFFQSLFPASQARQLINILKRLQNNLGDFQDFEVQVLTLKQYSQQMVDENTAPAGTLLAMGMLIDGLERRQHQARKEFSKRFYAFSLPENQRRFRDMFAMTAQSGVA